MTKLVIRVATADDAGVLAALEGECFSEAWTQAALSQAISDEKYTVRICEVEARAVGYVAGWSIGDEGELARVGVLSAQRGAGIGEALTRAFIANLQRRGVREIFLEVRVGNHTAQRLYERCGFENVGRRPKYYDDGEDAIIMRCVV